MKKQIFEKMDNRNLLTQFDEEEFQKLWDNFEWKHKYLNPIRHFMHYIPRKEYKGVEKMKICCFKCGKEVKKENLTGAEFYSDGEIIGYNCMCDECREKENEERLNPEMKCSQCGKVVTENRFGRNGYKNGEIFERFVICKECYKEIIKKYKK